jgi:hypothetical protein
MTAFNLKHYADALRELSDALSDPRRPLDQPLQKQTEELRERAQTFVGSYHLRVEPKDAELRVDGVATELASRQALFLGVGEHVLELDAPGYARLTRPVAVEGHGDQYLLLRLERLAERPAVLRLKSEPEPLAGPRVAAVQRESASARPASHALSERVFADYRFSWGFGAGALALAAAATGVHLSALAEARAVRTRCRVYPQCDPWDGVTARRDKLDGWSDGLLVGTLVFSAATLVLILVEHQRALERAATDRKYASAKSAP